MGKITLSVTSVDPEVMLAGDIFAAADPHRPVVPEEVVLRPTLNCDLTLAKGTYVYSFNVNIAGKFSVLATVPATVEQSKPFDSKTGVLVKHSFLFEVGA